MKFKLERYTFDHFFNNVIGKYSQNPALALVGDEPYTYEEMGKRVNSLRQSLYNLGIKKHNNVVIVGNSSPNWAIAYMAIMSMGAVAVPVLEGFPETDIDHILKHSGAEAIFISNELFENLSLSVLDDIKVVLRLDDFSVLSQEQSEKQSIWQNIKELPEKILKTAETKANELEAVEIMEDDLAEILYTSGTTGRSKGVMLTHKNLVSNLFEGPDLLKVINEKSVILSILPLAHAFGSTSAFLGIIYCGASIYFLTKQPSPKILMAAMENVRPTILGAVPLVFEKIYHKKVVPTIAQSAVMRLMAKTGTTKKLLYKIIGKKIYKLLGGRLDCVIIGGAAFSPEVEYFMQVGGIPYCCGYGLSECSPLVTFSSMEEQKTGSPGHAISDVTIKITDPESGTGIGEILVKGPNVMVGYYKNEVATKEVFTEDGWFITGDRGYLDEDGFLFITGRSKNVIVGPSGENIYPELVEAKLLESIFVEETLVCEMDKQVVARIYPDYAYIESLEEHRDEAELTRDITKILEEIRRDTNKQLPSFSKIVKVIEQTSPFIKTPTNKIKRAEYV